MGPSTEWKETVAPDEDERFERLATRLAAVQKARDASSRALHGKSHAGVRARLRVLDGLPAHARQGLFATPGEHRAYVRFSNGNGGRQPDRAPDLRGLAVKVLGVDGEKVLGDALTQDLLFIDAPALPFRSPDEFIALVCATAEPKGALGRVVREIGLFRAIGLLLSLAGTAKGKRASVADLTYFTVAPIAFGPYAARLAAHPLHAEDDTPASSDPGYLGERLRARLAKEPLEYELRAQFFAGDDTPIEDARAPWPTDEVAIARLVVERGDAESAAGRRLAEFVERLSFDPWHALVAHRPLGAVMRARKHAYYASVRARGAEKEPDGSEWAGFDRA